MGLLDLIEQDDRVRVAPYELRQLPAFLVANVPRRRADEPGDGVPLLVLAHIDAHHRVVVIEKELCKRLRQLRLTDARRSEEDERADWPVLFLQARAAASNGRRNRLNSFTLADNPLLELGFHTDQFGAFALEHARNRNAGPPRDDLSDVVAVDFLLQERTLFLDIGKILLSLTDFPFELRDAPVADLRHAAVFTLPLQILRLRLEAVDLLLRFLNSLDEILLLLPARAKLSAPLFEVRNFLVDARQLVVGLIPLDGFALDFKLTNLPFKLIELLRHRVDLDAQACRGLINQVDGLIRQKAIRDVAMAEFCSSNDGVVLNPNTVVDLVAILDPAQNRDGILDRRLIHHHHLETSLERLVFLEMLAVLIKRCCTDRAQLSSREGGFKNVCGIHRSLGRAGANQGMDLVDEEDDFAV